MYTNLVDYPVIKLNLFGRNNNNFYDDRAKTADNGESKDNKFPM